MRLVVYNTSVTADQCWRMGWYVVIVANEPVERGSVKVDLDRDFPTDVSDLEHLITSKTKADKLIRI